MGRSKSRRKSRSRRIRRVMKSRRIVKCMAAAAAAFLLCAGTAPVFAAPQPLTEIKVTNSVEISVIDITLTQSYIDEKGVKNEGRAGGIVLPGQRVSLIPTITNNGADCYVRIKLTSDVLQDGAACGLVSPVTSESLYGIQSGWKLVGDCLYDTEVLRHGESVNVFEGFCVPQEIGNEYAGVSFDICVTAEAVQADFFVPDFDSETPWGDLETEACIREGYDFMSLRIGTDSEISVIYEGGAKQFVAVPDDFFAHFGAMLPGGRYSSSVQVQNAYTEETEILFKTAAAEQTNPLLEKLRLTISMISVDGTEEVLYEGNYNSKELQEYVSLGTYAQGKSCTLAFEITVPEDLKNAFALTGGKVDWYFMARSNESVKSEVPGDPAMSWGAKTGDTASIAALLVLIAACGSLAAYQIVKCKKK